MDKMLRKRVMGQVQVIAQSLFFLVIAQYVHSIPQNVSYANEEDIISFISISICRTMQRELSSRDTAKL
jgi:hypothetical protein